MNKRRPELEVSAGGIVFRRLPELGPHFLLIRDSYDNWGFPKGHLEDGESPADAALRETAEETGLIGLVLRGPIRVIDWHFRFRGRHIHKYCHFFLLESPEGEPRPQADEGITDCQWRSLRSSSGRARWTCPSSARISATSAAHAAQPARCAATRAAPSGSSDPSTNSASSSRTSLQRITIRLLPGAHAAA